MPVIILLATVSADSTALTWEVAKQIIESQSSLATTAITALAIIAGLAMGGSALWSFHLSDRKLKNTIESFKAELREQIEGRMAAVGEEIRSQTNDLRSLRLELEGEKARMFALICNKYGDLAAAACWCARALEPYSKVGAESLARGTVDSLITFLKGCETLNAEQREEIESALCHIPPSLSRERGKIEGMLKSLE